MDFGWSEEEKAFRQEVQGFLEECRPPGWTKTVHPENLHSDELYDFHREMGLKLGAKGWLGIKLPEAYGGSGIPPLCDLILHEELFYRGLPGLDFYGVDMLAPVLMRHGTEEQKQRHLPRIAKGEVFWCEGFSEPDAGSDMAAAKLQARQDGDSYILNGQKVWTTGAHRADWGFFIARTDANAVPKHRGISFFLIDMKTPGISVRPLYNIVGSHSFNEIFLEDVRVPKENLVGEENKGWGVAMAVLEFERSILAMEIGLARRMLDILIQYLKEQCQNLSPFLAQDSKWQYELSSIATRIEAANLLVYRTVWQQSQGIPITYEASASKVFMSNLIRHINSVGIQLLDAYGQLREGSKWTPLNGVLSELYYDSFGHSIAAGTDEIQKNIIATRGLGLPRS